MKLWLYLQYLQRRSEVKIHLHKGKGNISEYLICSMGPLCMTMQPAYGRRNIGHTSATFINLAICPQHSNSSSFLPPPWYKLARFLMARNIFLFYYNQPHKIWKSYDNVYNAVGIIKYNVKKVFLLMYCLGYHKLELHFVCSAFLFIL